MTPDERQFLITLYHAVLLLVDDHSAEHPYMQVVLAELYRRAQAANLLYTDFQLEDAFERLRELNLEDFDE